MTPAKGYTEMKESGIEWLGKIPNNWCTIRVKYAFRIKKVIAGELGHTVLSVTQRGIKPKDMSEKGQFSLDYSKYQLVDSGDFIMNHMDLLTGWVDISCMNILDACYVSTTCSTKHYIKYPEGKINWKISSDLVKTFCKDLELGNITYNL